jgi:hypothetical protein
VTAKIAKIAGIAKIEKPKPGATNDTKKHEVKTEARGSNRSDVGTKSEVRVKRLEGHHGTGNFRPKVNGGTKGTEWELA